MKCTSIIILGFLSKAATSFTISSLSNAAASRTYLCSTTESPTEAVAPAPVAAPTSNQPEYGKTLELPDTYVRCGRCATSFALKEEDLGNGKGRRVECSVCSHSWFQSRDRLFTLNDGLELVPLADNDLSRISSNIEAGRDPDFTGNSKFYVGNLDFGVTADDLLEVFSEVGQVGDVSVVTGPDGRSRGFAFVTMMDEKDSEACMKLDGMEIKGRNVNVKPPNN